MTRVQIKLVSDDAHTLARSLEVKHQTCSFRTPIFAISPAQIDGRMLAESDLMGLVEVPVLLKSEVLRAMRKNETLQRHFERHVNKYMRRIPADQLVVLTPMFEGCYSEESEIRTYAEYAADLAANPRVDIVTTPVFYRSNEKFIVDFTLKFLEAITVQNVQVALTIPLFLSRETFEKFIEAYMSQANESDRLLTNFLCVDYNGSNPISRYTFHNTILRFAKAIEAETGEPVVIFGLNVKYSKMALKYDELPARDLVSYFVQLDAYAANHKKTPLPGEVIERSEREKRIEERLKILSRDYYAYLSIRRALSEHALSTHEKQLTIRLLKEVEEAGSPSTLAKGIRSLNAKLIIREALTLQHLLAEGTWDPFKSSLKYLESKKSLKKDTESLKRINILSERFKPKSEKLDAFF